MKAMILAAGMGTRLRPLTDYQPKAMVEVGGMPLLEIAIRRLIQSGCREIVINVHHFAEQIIRFLKKNNNFDIHIELSDEQDQLLETGGGLLNAANFFNDGQPFLLCNTDILTDLDIKAFYNFHLEKDGLATLGVRRRETSRYFIFDQNEHLCGWTNVKTGQIKMSRAVTGELQMWAFSGLHIIDPAIFELMPAPGRFSIVDVYLKAAANHQINAYPHDHNKWLDVGTPENLATAEPLMREIITTF